MRLNFKLDFFDAVVFNGAQDAKLAGDFGFVAIGLKLLPVCELGVIIGREHSR